jgi:hypothetical protein
MRRDWYRRQAVVFGLTSKLLLTCVSVSLILRHILRFLRHTPKATLCHTILIPTTLDVRVGGIHLHSSQIPAWFPREENRSRAPQWEA